MTNYFSQLPHSQQLQRAGRGSQLWGAAPFVYDDGPARGARALAVDTGGGLAFTLLVDRGLDAYDAHYCGAPLAWLSAIGPAHPAFYVEQGSLEHRSWGGGLFSTCGLRHAGQALDENGEHFGLHGRYRGIPAEGLTVVEDASADPPRLRITAAVRECQAITGPNLLNRRSLTVTFGRPEFELQDVITNEGHRPEEILVVYHINFGHPLLSESTRLAARVSKSSAHNQVSEKEMGQWREYDAPHTTYVERVYFHELAPDALGRSRMLLYNPRLGDGLGVEISAPHSWLPYLSQWKMLREREYVTGIEPGSGYVLGRIKERQAARLIKLEPGASHTMGFTLRIHTGEDLTRACTQIEE